MSSKRATYLAAGLIVVVVLLGACKAEEPDNTAIDQTETIAAETTSSAEIPNSGADSTTFVEPDVVPMEALPPSSTVELPVSDNPNVVDVPRFVPGGPEGYIPLWQCIAPAFRPAVASSDDFRTLRPSSAQLTRGLIDMTFMREPPCVRNLLDGGADINSYIPEGKDFGDGPALHLALNQKNWQLARYLLERGADPNVKTPYQNYSALNMALLSNAPAAVIEELKKRGATAN